MFVDVYLALSHLVTDAYGDFLSYFHGQYARVSAIGPVVGVEIAACVGWPPVQARAARVIIARNARATSLIYQLLVP